MNKTITCSYEDCGRDAWYPQEGEPPFCIFHSPKTEEKYADFAKAWKAFLGDEDIYRNINCEGFIFPTIINLRNFHFFGKVNFTHATFEDSAYFSGSTFETLVSFKYVKFASKVIFKNTIFKQDVDFSLTIFSDFAVFKNTTFKSVGNFTWADFTGTCLEDANFTNCSFRKVEYNLNKIILINKPKKLSHFWKIVKIIPSTNFTGIETQGILAASNRKFVRDIEDQQFINIVKEDNPIFYRIWLITSNCGRSFQRFLYICLGVSIIFGLIYMFEKDKWFCNTDEWSWITPFYYSIVTFSTLGFGDISPRLVNWVAQFWVMIEVLGGYLGLGILLSILANKFARRA